MVNVISRRCSCDSCAKLPSFNVKGSKSPLFCREHAAVGMVNIRNKICAHGGCTKAAAYDMEGNRGGGQVMSRPRFGRQ